MCFELKKDAGSNRIAAACIGHGADWNDKLPNSRASVCICVPFESQGND
jgi:hypothetical protein